MRRFVNGEDVELVTGIAEVRPLGDRLIVRAPDGTHTAVAIRDGDAILVSYLGLQYRIERPGRKAASAAASASGEIRAPMPGQVVDVRISEGDSVVKGQVLLVLEAMKTQQPFTAPFDGRVKFVGAHKGAQVDDGSVLVTVEPV